MVPSSVRQDVGSDVWLIHIQAPGVATASFKSGVCDGETMITVGMSAEKVLSVKEEYTAKAWGSGTLPVLATPKMILLVEETAMEAVATELPEGDTTVGTLVDVKHVSASPVGSEVRCRVEVVEVDRARIRFSVSVTDAFGDVGTGVHERFVVHSEKFMAKAQAKLQ